MTNIDVEMTESGLGYLAAEGDMECKLCHNIEETRPYGPNGERVCMTCAMKDEKAAIRGFKKYVLGESVKSIWYKKDGKWVKDGDRPYYSVQQKLTKRRNDLIFGKIPWMRGQYAVPAGIVVDTTKTDNSVQWALDIDKVAWFKKGVDPNKGFRVFRNRPANWPKKSIRT